jgi:hypothetical protein
LAKALTDYCIKWASACGKMPTAMKPEVCKKTLEEWLEKHGDDFNVMLSGHGEPLQPKASDSVKEFYASLK